MTISWFEDYILGIAAVLLLSGMLSMLRPYRSLLWGSGLLMLITALIPRPGNGFGQYLFAASPSGLHLPLELFGLAWWILGAWLVTSVLDLVLRKTIFPHDNQPHARRLFADLASALVYVVALAGIVETVMKQPISTVLATSGVLAIVLALALQNTLADVFSGLAINVEHPFRAGDWITMTGDIEGQVMEINWRATRIRSAANDLIIIPNSVIAKSIVTNHRKFNGPHSCAISILVDHRIRPAHVIDALKKAATGSPGTASNFSPTAYARSFSDTLVSYELNFGIDDFTLTPDVQSEVIGRLVEAFQVGGIPIGTQPIEVRLVSKTVTPPTDSVLNTQQYS